MIAGRHADVDPSSSTQRGHGSQLPAALRARHRHEGNTADRQQRSKQEAGRSCVRHRGYRRPLYDSCSDSEVG